jgi:GNAT superfamily N-acetyltransferase
LNAQVTEALQEHTSRYGSELGVQHYRLSLLAVHPRKQGKGLGRQLFTYVSQEAAAQDALLWFRCSNNNVSQNRSEFLIELISELLGPFL